jgi:hypothetical protein
MEMGVSRVAKASSEFMYIPTTGTGDDRSWNDKQQILILVGSDSEEDLRRANDQYTMSSHTDVARRSNEWRGTIKFKKPEVFDVVLVDEVSLETMQSGAAWIGQGPCQGGEGERKFNCDQNRVN